MEHRSDATKQGIVRMCVFILQTLSGENNFGPRLSRTFDRQDQLPASIRLSNWKGTYGDFLIAVGILPSPAGRFSCV
jgi:hypothetical protein